MFACTAAFAQTGLSGPPSLGTAPSPNGAAGASGNGTAYNPDRANSNNDSYVLQQGSGQYARVDQNANGQANTAYGGVNKADIFQGGTYSSGNNASQSQTYTGGGGAPRNTAYINQQSRNGMATQEQVGSSNTASIIQYGGTNPDIQNNTAYQNQNGTEHRAGIEQSNGSNDQAYQFQSDTRQYSTINQSGGNYNRAETNQSGANNTAIVTQR